VSGHDFSRSERRTKRCWALAPAFLFSITCNSEAAKAGILIGHLRHDSSRALTLQTIHRGTVATGRLLKIDTTAPCAIKYDLTIIFYMNTIIHMLKPRRLALGLLMLAVGNLSLIAALANRLALPFASMDFTKGFLIGLSIVMDATAAVLLVSAATAQPSQASPLAPGAK